MFTPCPPSVVGASPVSRLHRLHDVHGEGIERVRHAKPVFGAHLQHTRKKRGGRKKKRVVESIECNDDATDPIKPIVKSSDTNAPSSNTVYTIVRDKKHDRGRDGHARTGHEAV